MEPDYLEMMEAVDMENVVRITSLALILMMIDPKKKE